MNDSIYTEGINPRKSKNNHYNKNRRFDDDEQVINFFNPLCPIDAPMKHSI